MENKNTPPDFLSLGLDKIPVPKKAIERAHDRAVGAIAELQSQLAKGVRREDKKNRILRKIADWEEIRDQTKAILDANEVA